MKKIVSVALVIALLVGGLLTLTGCENGGKKNNGIEISHDEGKGKFVISVPKNEDGTPKYEFTKTKPEKAQSGTFYLETDTAIFSFGSESAVYNTSQKYKDKYGDKEPSFDNYLEWVHDPDSGIKLAGWEELTINERKAVRYYSRTGGSGDYVYHGYIYLLSADDIYYAGSRIDMKVVYKGDEELKEAKELDQETLDIINSLVISKNE